MVFLLPLIKSFIVLLGFKNKFLTLNKKPLSMYVMVENKLLNIVLKVIFGTFDFSPQFGQNFSPCSLLELIHIIYLPLFCLLNNKHKGTNYIGTIFIIAIINMRAKNISIRYKIYVISKLKFRFARLILSNNTL